ncbi:hypothetical protein B0H14DRAFT_1008876 [Mycena olivaceomarginata]|nr:hypothetical protein B0H14DRAFT_1008876 [Mycena olivaceomarginata]
MALLRGLGRRKRRGAAPFHCIFGVAWCRIPPKSPRLPRNSVGKVSCLVATGFCVPQMQPAWVAMFQTLNTRLYLSAPGRFPSLSSAGAAQGEAEKASGPSHTTSRGKLEANLEAFINSGSSQEACSHVFIAKLFRPETGLDIYDSLTDPVAVKSGVLSSTSSHELSWTVLDLKRSPPSSRCCDHCNPQLLDWCKPSNSHDPRILKYAAEFIHPLQPPPSRPSSRTSVISDLGTVASQDSVDFEPVQGKQTVSKEDKDSLRILLVKWRKERHFRMGNSPYLPCEVVLSAQAARETCCLMRNIFESYARAAKAHSEGGGLGNGSGVGRLRSLRRDCELAHHVRNSAHAPISPTSAEKGAPNSCPTHPTACLYSRPFIFATTSEPENIWCRTARDIPCPWNPRTAKCFQSHAACHLSHTTLNTAGRDSFLR